MNSKRLTASEMRAWRAYAETTDHLRAALEADLTPHGLSLGDYQVLVILSEATDGALRMCDLSEKLGLSPSGLTRRLDGLVELGYVLRSQCSSDRRVMFASITPTGLEALESAVSDHVLSVRRHLIDQLTPEQIVTLGDIFITVGSVLGRQPSTAP